MLPPSITHTHTHTHTHIMRQYRMKLALSGLYCLPLVSTTVYRGVKLDLKSDFPKGHQFVNWSFSSTTSSLEVLKSDQVCE